MDLAGIVLVAIQLYWNGVSSGETVYLLIVNSVIEMVRVPSPKLSTLS